jgi:hypothetical protein
MANRLCLGLWILCRLSTLAQSEPATVEQDKTVRMVYLVSKDRAVRSDYQQAIEGAIRELQGWYARQLSGPTFKLHNPVVEVAHASQPADWFYSHADGGNQDDWGFNNTLAEVRRLLGARYNDPHYIWVIYSDGPGNKGRGGSGVSCLPEDDLLGLIGQHPTQKEPARWVGGLGHELGHAFGLAHPTDTVRDADAIMWAGFYGKYPEQAYLTDQDKRILLRSPFFFDAAGKPVLGKETFTEKYLYEGGCFGRLASPGPAQWKEWKTESGESYYFDEIKREGEMIWLKDAARNITIQLPVKGGGSMISQDGSTNWQKLYDVHRD